MQASVRILSVLALGAVVALVVAVGTPAVLAYGGPTPHLVQVVESDRNIAKGRGSEGPIELPHPVEPAPGSFTANPSMTSSTPTVGSKTEGMVPGAMPTGRSGGAILDPAARAERSIQQVIRKLG